jgi:CRISPR-associated protein (TIGR02710 family)
MPESAESAKPKVVLATLGGSPQPLIKSLGEQRPDYVCFVVSPETKGDMEKVLGALPYRPKHHLWITTPSAESLSGTYRAITNDLAGILNRWGLDASSLVVDYTGGTKTMSAAVVLATIREAPTYTYVGGKDRTKEGKGVVVDGKERVLFADNPWVELAVEERRRISMLFNTGRLKDAADLASETERRLCGDSAVPFRILADLLEGFCLWDGFQHKRALAPMGRAMAQLGTFVAGRASVGEASLHGWCRSLELCHEFLKTVGGGKGAPETGLLVRDLVANADRRAGEGRYDDAVARLYRAIEAFAQGLLEERGITSSNVQVEKIPDTIREEFVAKYKNDRDGKIRVSQYAAYQLLAAMGDERGSHFVTNYQQRFRAHVDRRNNSLLAHGFQPVDQEGYDSVRGIVLEISGLQESDLPLFPKLPEWF